MQSQNGRERHTPGTSRDAAVERLLEDLLAGAPMEAAPDCLDAETLAAWQEGALRADAAASAEAHLSTCHRCQAMLAAAARATPPPSTPGAGSVWSSWRLWRTPWLVPAAAVATAVLIWVALPGPTSAPAVSDTMARLESVPSPLDNTRLEPAGPAVSQNAVPSSPAFADARVRPVEPSPARPDVANRDVGGEARRDANGEPAAAARAEFAIAPPAAAPPPDPAASAREATSDGRDNRDNEAAPASGAQADARLADAVSTPATAPAPGLERQGVQPAIRALVGGAQPDTAPTRRLAGRATTGSDNLERVGRQSATANVDIAAPNGPTRWRIRDARVVEYAPTPGENWMPATIPPSTGLTAGHSPAPSVCWIVGRGGLVIRTTDARRFTRVAFPEAVDLTTVRAVDARTASVTTRDGRTFRTDDGGATWLGPP